MCACARVRVCVSVTMSLLETGEISKVDSYISIGDDYTNKHDAPLHSVKGVRQFQTTGGVKTGQTGADWGEGSRSVKPLYQVRVCVCVCAGLRLRAG